jgi:hypothetical protein
MEAAMLINMSVAPEYLNDSLPDAEQLIDGLAFNVHDHHWLVYCALGGHEHYDLPDLDLRTGLSLPELYAEAA